MQRRYLVIAGNLAGLGAIVLTVWALGLGWPAGIIALACTVGGFFFGWSKGMTEGLEIAGSTMALERLGDLQGSRVPGTEPDALDELQAGRQMDKKKGQPVKASPKGE